jgi:hypothetical protein
LNEKVTVADSHFFYLRRIAPGLFGFDDRIEVHTSAPDLAESKAAVKSFSLRTGYTQKDQPAVKALRLG